MNIRCVFNAREQLCGNMLVKTNIFTGERCNLKLGKCEHQRGELYRYNEMFTECSMSLMLQTYTVLRETPKGYWVNEYYNEHLPHINEDSKKWVSNSSLKRLCYPTKKEAFVNFNRRKNRQLSILKSKVKVIEIACKLTEETPSINHNLL